MNQCKTVFFKFLLDRIISWAGELFVLFVYHIIDDYWFKIFTVELGARYYTVLYVSLVKQLGLL